LWVEERAKANSRECEPKQVLRTWKYDFKSFHEMLCAVEASWVWKGRELTADDVLPEYDSNLGPSMPLPKEPTCYGKEEDAVVISKCGDKKKLLRHWQYQRKRVGKLSCTADTMMALSVNGRWIQMNKSGARASTLMGQKIMRDIQLVASM